MRPLPVKHVVTCFLMCEGQILLLRRSEKVGSFRGRWAGVSGFIETTPDEQALLEVSEETGLRTNELQLLKKGETLTADDEGVCWVVHPYLYRIRDKDKIRIDWEHSDLRWIEPAELERFQIVPMLKQTLALVYPF
jgi:8-oxo-dGTP diphosphatase